MTSTPHRRPLALFAALAAMCGTLAITPAGAEPTDDPATGQPAAATIDPPPAGAKAPGAAVAAPDLEAQAAAQAGAGAAAAQPAAAASDIGHSLDTQPEVATQPVLDTQTEAGSDQPSLDAAVTINCANPPDAVTDTTALSWTFTTTPATATGTWRLELRDRGGAVLDSRTSTKTNSNAVTFNLGTKAVGYYVLTVTFDNAQTWSRSVVVVPSGTPPTDVRFGLDAHPSKIWSGGYNSGSQALQRYAALWKLAGITSIRDRVSWKATTEATDCSVVKWPNTSDYEADQYLVDQGFDVVTILQDAPQCANPAYEDSNPITMPPTNYAAVYQFGRQWAQGMGQLVDHIEYWNEENTDGFFPGYPYEYANGLKAFYAGVHSVDSSLDVLLGSTSYLPGDFMTEAYANGIGAFFDTRNQHYYGGNPHFYPNDPVYLDQMVEDSIAPLEQAYATASRPGWLTEMGYGIPANTTNLAASELAQAEYVAKTYAQGFASGYERVFYFFWPAYTEGTESPVIWGVVRPGDANVSGDENSLRPAYLTLALVTRHLQGTQAVALERHGADARSNGPDGRTVYFQKTDGSIVAITWGGGSSVLNQAGITVRDVFGKTLTTSDIQGNTAPLLVSNVPAIPVTATAVEYPAATTRASTPEQLFWVEGDFTVNGQALSHRHDRNNFYQPRIEPNQTIEVTAQPHLAGANLTAGQVTFNCPHGPGLSLVSKTASGTTFTCQFKADQAVGGKSYAAAEVLYQGRTDTTRLDVEVVAATRTALKNGTACTQWTWNATGNMTQSTFTQLADCTIQIGGAATTAGDMWVFPYVRIPAADRASLATMSGMRFKLTALPGYDELKPSKLTFMVQLLETDGEIWVINITPEADGTVTAFFDQVELATWVTKRNGRLDLNQVGQILIGWGGYAGTVGQRWGYQVGQIDLLAGANLLKPDGACPTWKDVACGTTSAQTVDLVQYKSESWLCPSTIIASVTGPGDAWVGPWITINTSASPLVTASGLRLGVSDIAGLPGKPGLLVQLLEKTTSETWVIWAARQTDGTYLFEFSKVGRLRPGTGGDGVFDLDKVDRIMVGWGNYQGVPGETRAFRVEYIELLPMVPPEVKSVSLAGTAHVGGTLTATANYSPADATVTYQWFRGSSVIAGATGPTYVLKAGDAGRDLCVKVTASANGQVSAARYSNHVLVLGASLVAISGNLAVGSPLTLALAYAPAEAQLTIRWYRGTSTASGSSGTAYTLTQADRGQDMVVKVTLTLDGFTYTQYSNHLLVP